MGFQTYNTDNPPKRGTAKKIYQALVNHGFTVHDLHYNANCWMRGAIDGWGTWACEISDATDYIACWCGWDEERGAYLQGSGAPYAVIWLANDKDT